MSLMCVEWIYLVYLVYLSHVDMRGYVHAHINSSAQLVYFTHFRGMFEMLMRGNLLKSQDFSTQELCAVKSGNCTMRT